MRVRSDTKPKGEVHPKGELRRMDDELFPEMDAVLEEMEALYPTADPTADRVPAKRKPKRVIDKC